MTYLTAAAQRERKVIGVKGATVADRPWMVLSSRATTRDGVLRPAGYRRAATLVQRHIHLEVSSRLIER